MPYDEEIFIPEEHMLEIMQGSFIVSKLYIQFVQESIVYQLVFPLETNINDISNIYTSKIAYLYNYGNDTGYELMFEYNQSQVIKQTQHIDALQYDYVMYKYSQQILTESGMQKLYIQQSSSKLNLTQRSVKFSCGSMTGQQQKTCYQMLYNDQYEVISAPIYNLDVMFYSSGKLIHLIKAYNCRVIYTCWNQSVAVLSKNNLILYLTRNYVCDSYNQWYDYTNISTSLFVLNQSYNVQQRFDQYLPVANSTNINVFNFSCTKINCADINLSSQFMFEMNISYFTERVYISKVFDEVNQKHIIQITQMSIGVALLIVFVSVSIIKFKQSQILIEHFRGKENSVKMNQIKRSKKEKQD
ncbi:Hypothetical_protein [Hexamita inflata]|uniref:Hypothetical_protein n=1 Tax=Hexamita inflata TaxID=28002 RepID=A0AA86RKA9_9EUKA|nr:Hypothetical protein HINF_LOCUS33645 [Hexamita inflata]CAI9968090.1 Hypothetical protein HINF_LOCUS55735 [Hexamita inflata]